MVFIHILIGLATVAYCLYLYFTRTFNYWRDRNVASPTPVPLFGNIMQSALRREPLVMVMKKIYDDFPDEKLVGVYRMTTPDLLIRDPDMVKQVMIKDFDHFSDRGEKYSEEGLGTNLFHAEAMTWRILRDKFSPLFTSGKLKNMVYLITEKGDEFVKCVESLTQTQPEQEVNQLLQKYTLATIAACAFGLDVDMTKGSYIVDSLINIDKKIFTPNYFHELNMMYPGILRKLGMSIFPSEVTKFFNDLVRKVITVRKGAPTNRKDFMDIILEMRQAKELQETKRLENKESKTLEITDSVIAAQCFMFFVAGYEPTSRSIGNMLMLLALNPDAQEKVVAEIKEVLARYDGKITYEALNDMVYLDRVFDETLRMYPIGDTIQRTVTADYKFPGTALTLKEGQSVLVSASGIHYDEKYWVNPTKFDPDRFSPTNSAGRHQAVYLSFGIGPRQCIATRFAKLQSRVCLVKLLQRFRLEATEHTRRRVRYDPYRLGPAVLGGFKMNILPRVDISV